MPAAIPSDDELELAALDFLRQRFLRTDERMVGLLATLERQIDAAPARERPSIRHAANEIAKIQQRLRAQIGSLPPSADESRKIIKGLLQVQGGALEQLSALVEHNTRQAAKVAHSKSDALTKPRPASVPGGVLINAHIGRSLASKAHATPGPLGRRHRHRRHQRLPSSDHNSEPALCRPLPVPRSMLTARSPTSRLMGDS